MSYIVRMARVHVKIFAPMIGRLASARRVRVVHYARTVDDALSWCRSRRGGAYWLEAREQPAHRPLTRRVER